MHTRIPSSCLDMKVFINCLILSLAGLLGFSAAAAHTPPEYPLYHHENSQTYAKIKIKCDRCTVTGI
jgi:hypothetical protein